MTPNLGIDTSVLVRIASRQPEGEYRRCAERIRILVEEQGREIFASNQVIGEAYIVLQYHYEISAPEARAALVEALTSGLVAPLNGQSVIEAL